MVGFSLLVPGATVAHYHRVSACCLPCSGRHLKYKAMRGSIAVCCSAAGTTQ